MAAGLELRTTVWIMAAVAVSVAAYQAASVAMTQFESWQAVLGAFICLNIIQFVVGSYVEPRVSGSVLSISPFVVLFAIFFWTFLWGLFGTFIGVPITLALE